MPRRATARSRASSASARSCGTPSVCAARRGRRRAGTVRAERRGPRRRGAHGGASRRASATLDPELGTVARLLDEVRPVLEDAALRAGARARAISADPERLEQVEERIATLQRLARKYVCTPAELAGAARRYRAGARRGRRRRGRSRRARGAVDDGRRRRRGPPRTRFSTARARRRTAARRAHHAGLRELALGGARVVVALEPVTRRRRDAVPSRPRRSCAQRATGAERVGVALRRQPGGDAAPARQGRVRRRAVAHHAGDQSSDGGRADVPTLLFDEVDAGIGGAVAETVGRKLAALGRRTPGHLHHALAADCRMRGSSFRGAQARGERPDAVVGGATLRRRARRRAGPHAGGGHGHQGGPAPCGGAATPRPRSQSSESSRAADALR